jgi:hypothetical protein
MGAGIDWLNRLGTMGQEQNLINDLKRVILQTDGITSIVSFSITKTGRALTANYYVTTINSTSFTGSVSQGV